MIKKRFIFPIYKVFYDLHVHTEDKDWYCKKRKIWTDLGDNKYGLSSNASFKKKKEALIEFRKLAISGVDCVLYDRKIIFGKGWYFVNEWHSKDQKYFNEVNKCK